MEESYLQTVLTRTVRAMHEMTPDERAEFIQRLGKIYCIHCGILKAGLTCNCTRDE